MNLEEKKISAQVNKSKLVYAFSLIDNIVNSKDPKKIKNDLQRFGKFLDLRAKGFEDLFKLHKGFPCIIIMKLNPNCDC